MPISLSLPLFLRHHPLYSISFGRGGRGAVCFTFIFTRYADRNGFFSVSLASVEGVVSPVSCHISLTLHLVCQISVLLGSQWPLLSLSHPILVTHTHPPSPPPIRANADGCWMFDLFSVVYTYDGYPPASVVKGKNISSRRCDRAQRPKGLQHVFSCVLPCT